MITNSVVVDDDLNEFIELVNTASTNVSLFSPVAPTNTWRLNNAVDFSFPTNRTLVAGSNCFIVSFNPTNTSQLATFRAKWALPVGVSVFGPWSGKLDNSSSDLKLERPDPPNLDGSVPFLIVERVQYTDSLPWDVSADGFGTALQRNVYSEYANDPSAWSALPVVGTVVSDSDGDGMADWWEIENGLNPFVNDAALDPDGDGMNNLRESVARTNPHDATSALRIQSVKAGIKIELSFEAQAQLTYAVQTNNILNNGSWQTWQQIAAAPTNHIVVFTNGLPGMIQFYRVRTPAN